MGEPPEDYGLLQAARYLSVAPWDLAEQPTTYWRHLALDCLKAENDARAHFRTKP